ncbi:alpha/beta hydrolase [Candidatus Saccharibacteria bacterium]|nr:MAG: alpha/beta hydrolase [Candidatus Saccharibacteria bacterium]
MYEIFAKIEVSPYAVIGHSNGGAIAVRGIGQGQFVADKLVLLASAGVRNPRANQGLKVMAKVGKMVVSHCLKKVRSRLRRQALRKGRFRLVSRRTHAGNLQADSSRRCQVDAAYISTPTLLVYGDKDDQTPPSRSPDNSNTL